MKWYKNPIRTVRRRSGFLLLPRAINNESRWLEWARWEEHWMGSWGGGGWYPVKWL